MTHTHTKTYVVVSKHFLRRTARWKAARLEAKAASQIRKNLLREPTRSELREIKERFQVMPATRGPYRWYVVEY